jgi:hypothetical protein
MDELCEECAAREAAGNQSNVLERESKIVHRKGGGDPARKKSS